MTARVTALLVSHDGARWLPAVLDGLANQTRRPDGLVVVDTGSTDEGPALVRERYGPEVLHELPARTPYGEAVRAGLELVPETPAAAASVVGREAGLEWPPPPRAAGAPGADTSRDDWVWLLHDDSAPAPDALETLLAAAEENPSVDILGPKLREWPSLRRLLEVGVTISGTGRRETGLERGEYDQGQHDRIREVLAVNTAGMLVRRSVLAALGIDPRLPVFGNDLDLGWRAARAGHRCLVVPDAVVFHAEAAHRGLRRTSLTGRHLRRGERKAALYTLLANGSAASLPFRLVRLLLGSLLRALGFLLVRAPGEAWDEIAAVGSVYARPVRILAARRRRRRTAQVPHRDVRPLLAPPWLPYRHGLDFVSDVAAAVVSQATDYSSARRARLEATETGPVPAEAQNLPEDTGLVARALRSPAALGLVGLVVVSVIAARGLVGSGLLWGGALLPAPASAAHWWRTYLESAHAVGSGSSVPTAPYLLPLALLGSILLGKAWLLVDVVFLLAVPVAAFGAFRFLMMVTGSRPAALWGGLAYGLLPVLTGAVQEGRLGTVVTSLALPWLAHAAVFLAPGASADRRWRAAWRTTLWLALIAAFTPLALLLAVLLVVVVVGAGLVTDRARWARPATWLPVIVPVLGSLVLLLPWSVSMWAHQGPSAWLFEAGLPAPRLTVAPSWLDVVFGRPASVGAPWWLGAGLVLAALAALVRSDTRSRVLGGWTVITVCLGLTAVLSGLTVTPPTGTFGQPVWLGLPLLVAQAAAVYVAAVAGTGIRERLTGANFGWRQPVGAVLVVVALLTPVVGLMWWAVAGSDGPLDRRPANAVPTYMSDASQADPLHGTLVLRGDRTGGFRHLVVRTPGLRLGGDSVLPSVADQRGLTDLVTALVTAPEPSDVKRLASYGVAYVYALPPVDVQLAGNLDSLSGVTSGSATGGARAWQLQPRPTDASLDTSGSALRPWLLLVQGVALVVVVVLAAPTRKVAR